MDLQNSAKFKELGVEIVSIARDPIDEQASAARDYGITVPMLVDSDGKVSTAYDVMQYALPNGEPGHTFVLVNSDGKIAWMKDYGAPNNPDRTMYVEIDELYREVKNALDH